MDNEVNLLRQSIGVALRHYGVRFTATALQRYRDSLAVLLQRACSVAARLSRWNVSASLELEVYERLHAGAPKLYHDKDRDR